MTRNRQALFEAVRAACFPATWSRGIELTRAKAVVGEQAGDEEVVFRVTTRAGMICPKVSLYPEDLDWDCECASRERVCPHVAAAVIAWQRAAEEGGDLPAPDAPTGRVGYRFRRIAGGLSLSREIVVAGEAQPLDATLAALASGRVRGPRFLATQADLAVELALGTHRRGVLPPHLVPRVFAPLAACEDVALDGAPVRVAREPLLPVAVLADQGDGFRLSLVRDESVTEVFDNGIALRGDVLCVVGDPKLTARERQDLTAGLSFGPAETAELVTEVLPALRRRIPVDVRTDRLPETTTDHPRIVIEVERQSTTLSVLATLVYGDPPTARVDGGKLVHLGGPVPLRNESAEAREIRRVQRLGLVPGVRAAFEGVEAVAFNASLEAWEGAVKGSGREAFRMAAPLQPRVRLAGESLEVTFESPAADGGGARRRAGAADAGAVLRAWREGASLVPLLEGGWAELPRNWLDRFGERIADLLAARQPDGRIPACCGPDLAALCEDLDQTPPPESDRIRRLLGAFERIPEAALPAALATSLRPYQRQGVDWLVFLRDAGLGALLADDMGLGKTIQALCAVRGRTLVVAPTSVLHSWVHEIRTHRPDLVACVFHGPRRELNPAADVTLTTYAILRIDADRLAGEDWDSVVLDEAQNIKNPESQVAGAAFRLQAGFHLALTGTPVENRLDELWSQFHFINRGLLGGRRDFQERYADPIGRGEAGVAERLRSRIRPFLLRRLKQEVARDLPPRSEMVLRCDLAPEEREVYDAIRAATLAEVVSRLESDGGGVLAALEALLRLRQAACHVALVPGQVATRSSKIDLLLEALDSVVAEGHRALVFSQWTSLLDLAEPPLRSAGVPFLRLDGSTRDRGAVVEAFQSEGGPPVMLISLKAGGTGLNLTAADHVFLLDPWWNPAVEDQAADRAHRIGQERPVMIYRLVANETVEERILALQERKRELANAALGDAARAAALTREDLLSLLE